MSLIAERAAQPDDERSAAETTAQQPAPTQPAVPAQPAVDGTKPAHRTESRVHAIDMLRFFCAFAVVSYHLIFDDKGTWGINSGELFTMGVRNVAKYGWVGVECFFVISGFVICMSSWGRSVADFFISRVVRLMPAYLFAVLVTAAVLMLWPLADGRPQPTHVLYHLTFLHPFLGIPDFDTVYWTLFIELKFYLLFTIVVHFGLTYRRVVLFCILWTVASLYAQFAGPWPFFVIVEPRFTNYFVAGITLYLMYRFGPTLLLWCILGTSMILSLFFLNGQVTPFNTQWHVMSFPIAGLITLGFFLVMIAVALGWLSWLRWRGLTVLGALTYPLYLLHAQISRVIILHFHRSVQPVLLLCLLMVGVLVLAYLVHRLVERPVASYLRNGLRSSFDRIRAADLTAPPTRRRTAGR
jgi:peptidoglycan/LPS O-acetylase OafA/YrhL